jgi:hypothetical protein
VRCTTATFGSAPRFAVVDQNASHLPRSNGKEVGTVGPRHLHICQQQKGLVHQRGGLQRVASPFAAHGGMRQPLQLFVDQRRQFIQGPLVTGAPGAQQPGDLGGWLRGVICMLLCHATIVAGCALAELRTSQEGAIA